MSFPAEPPPARSLFLACDEAGLALDLYVALGAGPVPPKSKAGGLERRQESLLQRVRELEARVLQLEGDGGEAVVRAKAQLATGKVHSARWCWVPEDYYARPLEARGALLGAAVPQMCKTMLMENVAHDPSVPLREKSYERFYLVVLQYGAALASDKLLARLRDLRGTEGEPGNARLGRKKYDLVMAPEETMNAMTGFPHNGVTPFGCAEPVTVILSAAIMQVQPAFIWMGGGHPLLKLGVALKDFVRVLDPLVLDVSNPR